MGKMSYLIKNLGFLNFKLDEKLTILVKLLFLEKNILPSVGTGKVLRKFEKLQMDSYFQT